MSKVFIVRFHVIQFTRYSVVRSVLPGERYKFYHKLFSLSSTFFKFLKLFLKDFQAILHCNTALADSFDIIADISSSVKHLFPFFSFFFVLF